MSLRAGLVGCGGITDTHARATLEAGLLPAAFFGRETAKAEALSARYGGRACASWQAFLDQPLDLVIIGSPSGLHAEQGLAAVERGLHVLVEKPIDVTVARAEALVSAAERRGVKLGVLLQSRLEPDLVRARDFVRGGGLGRVLLASARVKWHRPPEYYAESGWRGTLALDGGAALINQGIHTADLLLWLLGPVSRVKAIVARRLHAIEGEDTALVLLEFASGAVATLEATTAAWPGYPRRLELTGTEGTLVIEGEHVVQADLRSGARDLVRAEPGDASNAASAVLSDATPHRRMIEDFARAISKGATPACDGREGLQSLALVEAVYAAARRPAEEVS